MKNPPAEKADDKKFCPHCKSEANHDAVNCPVLRTIVAAAPVEHSYDWHCAGCGWGGTNFTVMTALQKHHAACGKFCQGDLEIWRRRAPRPVERETPVDHYAVTETRLNILVCLGALICTGMLWLLYRLHRLGFL